MGTDARLKVKESLKIVENLKTMKKTAETDAEKNAIKKKVQKAEKSLMAAKNALGAAKVERENTSMQLNAARVGAGKGSPGEAMDAIAKDKQNLAKNKVTMATQVVTADGWKQTS